MACATAMSYNGGMRRQLIKLFVSGLVYAGIFWLTTGRFDWWRGWFYIGLSVAGGLFISAIVRRMNPQLLVQRAKVQRGTKRFDKIIMTIYLLLMIALPAVGGLDAGRFGWSSMPAWTVYAAVLVQCVAIVPMTWALAVNPFAENTVRIQTERGHKAVAAGPYRIVRHPMYAGMVVGVLAAPPLLGSVWAFVPAGLIAVLIVVRTALEDRALRGELGGYREYAERTRYRLLPGVW